MTRRRRPGSPGVSPLRGGSFRRVLRAQALRRGGCRARHPGDRPPAVLAVSRCRARQHHGQADDHAPGAPIVVKMSQSPGRNAAHCPGRSLQPQRCFASRYAGRAFGAPLTPETSTGPAGLTARARPEARPYWRAANLRDPQRSPSGDALRILRAHVDPSPHVLHTFSTRSPHGQMPINSKRNELPPRTTREETYVPTSIRIRLEIEHGPCHLVRTSQFSRRP